MTVIGPRPAEPRPPTSDDGDHHDAPPRPAGVDEQALDEFLGRAIGDLGATVSAALVVIGDRLGLYRAMADGGPATADELADRTGTAPPTSGPGWPTRRPAATSAYDPADETLRR